MLLHSPHAFFLRKLCSSLWSLDNRSLDVNIAWILLKEAPRIFPGQVPAKTARGWRNLADALDLGSSTKRCGGSSPPPRTTGIDIMQVRARHLQGGSFRLKLAGEFSNRFWIGQVSGQRPTGIGRIVQTETCRWVSYRLSIGEVSGQTENLRNFLGISRLQTSFYSTIDKCQAAH